MQPSESDYRHLMSDLLKNLINVLGPDVVLIKVKNVNAVRVNTNGEAVMIYGDPSTAFEKLINEYISLAPFVTKQIIRQVLANYPQLSSMRIGD